MNKRDFAAKILEGRGYKVSPFVQPEPKVVDANTILDSIIEEKMQRYVGGPEVASTIETKVAEVVSQIPPAAAGETPIAGFHYPTHEQTQEMIDKRIAKIKVEPGKQGDPGKPADPVDEKALAGRIVQDVIPRVIQSIPSAKELDMEALFENFIKKIRDEKLLSTTHLKDYETFVFNGTRYKTHELMHGGGSSGSTSTSVYGEVVSGSGTTWTLAHTPDTGTVRLFANGQRLTETVDYTLSGGTITTILSWDAGTILADYAY